MLRFHTTQANASISAAQEKEKILILVLALMLAFMLASLVKTRLNLGMVAEWKTRMSKKKHNANYTPKSHTLNEKLEKFLTNCRNLPSFELFSKIL